MIVSRETADQLALFRALIEKWNPHINLIAPASLPQIHERHIVDCLQIADHGPFTAGNWCDLGSGGGLPGLVLAVALGHTGIHFTMIESDKRKAAFLITAIRELSLGNASVINQRIETASPQKAANISARALAPVSAIIPYVKRHMHPDGTAWLMKGENWQSEVELAAANWNFSYEAIPSKTKVGAILLKLHGISDAQG